MLVDIPVPWMVWIWISSQLVDEAIDKQQWPVHSGGVGVQCHAKAVVKCVSS